MLTPDMPYTPQAIVPPENLLARALCSRGTGETHRGGTGMLMLCAACGHHWGKEALVRRSSMAVCHQALVI